MRTTTLAVIAALGVLATSSLAQDAPPRLTVGQPVPGPLTRGVALIPIQVEGLRIVPLIAADSVKYPPGTGHLHVTFDDLPWHWTDFSGGNTIALAGLPRGRHKVLIELSTSDHHVLLGRTVTFTVP